ncbi:hypothetical protein [Lacrimispora sp.]|uniref:hypothetical protein n=1 Tax=Lacrimispora sp. TaxID=2719234 RepID=UPI0032E3CD52
MIKFLNKKTGEIGEAYKIEKKIHIQFTENGKEYQYDEKNIEILKDEKVEPKIQCNDKKNLIPVYSFKRKCYSSKCGKITEILTYIKFDDGTDEDMVYPWDKNRLNKNKLPEAEMYHMENPSIEYYPIKVIGSDKEIDELMLKKFPEKIQTKYSGTQKRRYPMNICQYCGAKQGEYFIYEWVNKAIQKMEALPVFQMIESESGINQQAYGEQNAKAFKKEYLKPKRSEVKGKNQIYIYSMIRTCHTCREKTEILTYAKYDDGTGENLIYPWDKKRLDENKSLESEMRHIRYPTIEYYPIKVFGSDEGLDNMMFKLFPERISKYLVNVCQHCGAKQKSSYIYRKMNRIIKDMEELPVFKVVYNK